MVGFSFVLRPSMDVYYCIYPAESCFLLCMNILFVYWASRVHPTAKNEDCILDLSHNKDVVCKSASDFIPLGFSWV